MGKRFILSLLLIALLAACGGGVPEGEAINTELSASEALAQLPEGDATNGEQLYSQAINGAPTCSGCHLISDQRLAGPGLAGLADVAAERVEGQSAAEYIYNSIVHVDNYVVEGYSNAMYARYGDKLTRQQLADLIAYMLTLS